MAQGESEKYRTVRVEFRFAELERALWTDQVGKVRVP